MPNGFEHCLKIASKREQRSLLQLPSMSNFKCLALKTYVNAEWLRALRKKRQEKLI